MRIRYKLSRFDLFRAGLRAMLHQRVLLIVLGPFLVFIWWSVFTSEQYQGEPLLLKIIAATVIAGMCGGVGFLAGALIVAAQSFFRRDKGVLGEHTMEMTEEGLIEFTEVSQSLFNWRTSFRIRETKRYAFIYISLGNAHVIPKTKPPLEGSVVEFLDELRLQIQKFQQGPAPNGNPTPPVGDSGDQKRPPSVN